MGCREALQQQRRIKQEAVDLAKAAGKPDELLLRQGPVCKGKPGAFPISIPRRRPEKAHGLPSLCVFGLLPGPFRDSILTQSKAGKLRVEKRIFRKITKRFL